MIFDLVASDRNALALEADVCIIGGGIAGLLAAQRIADAGRRVVVLESGGTKHLAGRFDALNELDEPMQLYKTAVTGRARALGGTSNLWGGRMLPLTAHDIGARPYLGLDAWPIDKFDLDCHLPEIQRLFGLDDSSFEADLDLPYGLERLSQIDPFIRSRWAKWPTFARRNVANLLHNRLKQDSYVQVWLNATAHRFVVDFERARLKTVCARDADGRTISVRAEEFIFASGTFETTRLLLLLDRSANGRPFEGCEALGRYFNDHLALEVARLRNPSSTMSNRIFGYHIGGFTRRSLHLETTARAQEEDGVASGYITVRPEFSGQSILRLAKNFGQSAQLGTFRSLFSDGMLFKESHVIVPATYWRLVHKQMYFSCSVDLFLDARVEQVPMFASRLSLSDHLDPFGVPKLRLEWVKSARDEQTFRAVVGRARHLWRSTILSSVSPLDWNLDPDDPDCSFTDVSRDTRHPAGTTRMGVDGKSSVVGRDLRCHSILNVLVASAAAFPSSGSANPSLTIMQLALHAADSVLKAFQT